MSLQKFLNANRIKQTKLAEILNISPLLIFHFKSGRKIPSLQLKKRIYSQLLLKFFIKR